MLRDGEVRSVVYGALDWTRLCHGECQGKLGLGGWEAGALEVSPTAPQRFPRGP